MENKMGYKVKAETVAEARTASVSVRIEPSIKERAEAVMAKLGLSASDAINLLYRQVILKQALPFEVSLLDDEVDPLEEILAREDALITQWEKEGQWDKIAELKAKRPKCIEPTDEELKEMLEEGYQQALEGRDRPFKEVMQELRAEYGWNV